MKTTTTTFDTSVAASLRMANGKLVFKILDSTASTDVTLSSTSTSSISDIDYINDGVDSTLVNYATFEDDSWVLDGTKALMPDSDYINMGWWSDALSDASSNFTPIVITADGTTNHTTAGFTIIFDDANQEYAEDFTIVYKDSGASTIETVTVSGNTDITYVSETGVNNWQDIVLTITKWSAPFRRAKIQEVYFGLVEIYTRENLLRSITTQEEVELLSTKIIPDQCDFAVDNQDQSFNLLAPTGKFASLQKQQTIEPYFGFFNGSFYEYIRCGIYYLDDWKTDKSDFTARFSGKDRLFLLNQSKFYKGLKPATSDTLTSLVETVLQDAGLTSANYNIDTALDSITTTNFLPVGTHKEVLKHIAIAGRAVVYSDSEGIIQVKQLGTTSSGYTYSKTLTDTYPVLELDDVTYQVDVEVVNWEEAAAATQIFKGTKAITGTETIFIPYTDPATSGSAALSVGSLDSATYYTNGAELTITHTGSTVITIDGKKLTKNTFAEKTLTGETDGELQTVKSDLIDTSALALSVGTWASGVFTDRVLVDNVWRGNPATEVGDIVDNETEFSDLEDAIVYKINRTYDGGYAEVTKVRGEN